MTRMPKGRQTIRKGDSLLNGKSKTIKLWVVGERTRTRARGRPRVTFPRVARSLHGCALWAGQAASLVRQAFAPARPFLLAKEN
jgi:hypothetical protein